MSYDKNLALLQTVMLPFHPFFRDCSAELREAALKRPTLFNCELGVEEALAEASNGQYTYVNGNGFDFSDGSDSKTATVNANTRKVEVFGIATKTGALRIVIYNPLSSVNSLAYMFIPQSDVSYLQLPCYGKNSHDTRLVMTYTNGHYNKFDRYRVKTFVDLAQAR